MKIKNSKKRIDDSWLRTLVLGNLGEKKRTYRQLIKLAKGQGISLASAKKLYQKRKELGGGFVIPAFNLRGMTFELACGVFQAATELKTEFFIFEIARSELNYTQQHPYGYAGLVLLAAMASAWQGPVYLQADHLQLNPDHYHQSLLKEIHTVKKLIRAYLRAGFFSLDLDCSGLNNLEERSPAKLLKENLENSIKLLKFLQLLKKSKEIAVGLEVGEIGARSTTQEELKWFLENLKLKIKNSEVVKIAIQTGTKHGGEVDKEGKLRVMSVDLERLAILNQLAQTYGFYGVVQHGASTLPLRILRQLPQTGVLEVHLGTAFQNLIFGHPDFPEAFKLKIYQWLTKNFGSQLNQNQSKEQFYYKMRKMAWGKFRQEFLSLSEEFKFKITKEMKEKTKEFFKALKIYA